MRKIIFTFYLASLLIPACVYGQTPPVGSVPETVSGIPGQQAQTPSNPQRGYFSGSFQSNTNFFIRDSSIGASGLPQYDNLKIGTDVWFNLNYTNEQFGLDVGVRFDAFLNSIIFNPSVPYTGVGLGSFFVKKKFKNLTITGGYLYDQIATGMIYRAYEERTLGIDNALIGGRVEYDIDQKVHLKVFSGVQKDIFTVYNPIISGFNGEGNFPLAHGKVILSPGVGIINRSMDQASMNALLSTLAGLDSSQRFTPKYNVYAFSFYNTLTAGPVSWFVEGDYKTRDAIYEVDSTGANNVLVNKTGNAVYSSLNASTKGLGVTLLFKRVQDFILRTSPNQTLLNGLINFEPPVARENSLRLPALYYAPSLTQHELAFGTEITYTPVNKLTFVLNGSYIRDFIFGTPIFPDSSHHRNFFGEGNIEIHYKPSHKVELELGFQYIFYNRPIYQTDAFTIPAEYSVHSYTPFAEITQKITRKMSYRIELQYQYVPADFGQWMYGLFEFNIAPAFSVAVSDMWNFKPNPDNVLAIYQTPHHFYSAFVSYTHGASRFSLNYVKQVAGIVCTGGVCRYEPAFSGVKFAITTTF